MENASQFVYGYAAPSRRLKPGGEDEVVVRDPLVVAQGEFTPIEVDGGWGCQPECALRWPCKRPRMVREVVIAARRAD